MSLQIVQQIRAKYPTPLGDQHAAFLVEVACATGKGLLRKPGGTNIPLPDGTRVSQDIVMDRSGLHWDILVDGEGQAIPTWNLVTEPPTVDPARYYGVSCSEPGPEPEPEPDPGHDDDLAKLQAQIVALTKRVEAVEASVTEAEADAAAAKTLATNANRRIGLLKASGAINVPVVLDGLRARAKGDVSLTVSEG